MSERRGGSSMVFYEGPKEEPKEIAKEEPVETEEKKSSEDKKGKGKNGEK